MKREEIRDKAKNLVDRLFDQIEKMDSRTDRVAEDAREAYRESVAELKLRREDLKKQYDKLDVDERWDEFRNNFDQTFDTVKERTKSVWKNFKDRFDGPDDEIEKEIDDIRSDIKDAATKVEDTFEREAGKVIDEAEDLADRAAREGEQAL